MKYLLIFYLLTWPAFSGTFAQKMKPFIDKHCVSCHGEKKQEGKLRLDSLSTDLTDLDTAEQWQDILDELNAAAMPPEDEAQPSKEHFTEILELLTYNLTKAKKMHYGKKREIVMRRLNKREYINTMYELTGIRLKDTAVMGDRSTAEFDNHGEGLYVSSFLLAEYRKYAYQALDKALSKEPVKVFTYEINDFAKEKNDAVRKEAAEIKKNDFKSKRKKVKHQKLLHARLLSYLAQPDSDKGFLVEDGQEAKVKPRNGRTTLKGVKAKFKISVNGRVKNLEVGDKPYLIISKQRYIDLSELINNQKEISIDVYLKFSHTGDFPLTFHVEKAKKIKGKNHKYNKYSVEPIDPNAPKLVFNSVKIVSLEKNVIEDAFKKVFTVSKRSSETDAQYTEKIIKNFAFKAYRGRPISDRFLKILTDLYKNNVSNGRSQIDAIKEPLAIILSSPKFIYLTENSTTNSKFVSDLELAVRLSYFLWSSPPDQELYNLAYSGKLSSKQTLRSQVYSTIKRRTVSCNG
jgi:hypothetical protein